MGGKLDIRWNGPYQVMEACDKLLFRLKNVRNKKVLKRLVHCSRLKIYQGAHQKVQELPKESEEVYKAMHVHVASYTLQWNLPIKDTQPLCKAISVPCLYCSVLFTLRDMHFIL